MNVAPPSFPESLSERRLRNITLFIARMGLADLFFSQLFWKLPPHFGCPEQADFALTITDGGGAWRRTSGLCDWIGVESVWSKREWAFFGIDFDNDGKPDVAMNLPWLRGLNGRFVDRMVIPHFGLFGWLIFLAELAIIVSMLLGLLTRAGALISILISAQLTLGIAGVSDPAAGLQEWEWSYHLMVLLSLLLFGNPPVRFLGLDVPLRKRLGRMAQTGGHPARWLMRLT